MVEKAMKRISRRTSLHVMHFISRLEGIMLPNTKLFYYIVLQQMPMNKIYSYLVDITNSVKLKGISYKIG